jgi:hypothetical protein
MLPSPAELAALADKYHRLVQLRVARDSGGPEATREQLRDLSRRFPGSLRELDTLGEGELRRRARAAATGAAEPWMAWITTFHHLMRAALLVKAARARDQVSPIADQELAEQVRLQTGLTIELELLRAFARPPQGRLAPLVLAEVARAFQVDGETLRACLFPRRR